MHMSAVDSRDLRNHTAEILRRVQRGETVTVSVDGAAVAEIGPPRSRARRHVELAELLEVLDQDRADPGLRADLAELAGETTDDLDPR